MENEINRILEELSDLSDIKVGDKLYSSRKMDYTKAIIVDKTKLYSIETDEYVFYAKLDKFYTNSSGFRLYKENPFLVIAKHFSNNYDEKWMMVSNDNKNWVKRKIIMFKNDKYIAWSNAESEKEIKTVCDACSWKYAKEIEEEKTLELTLEEIAENFNVKINNLKIIK